MCEPPAHPQPVNLVPDASLLACTPTCSLVQLPAWCLQVVLFAVPGAFTPTCSLKHLPGFIEKADELKSKGVDTIACVAVNDAFVMEAWSKSVGADDKVMMLADGSAVFAKASQA